MSKTTSLFLFFLTLLVLSGCQEKLTKKEIIANGISVMLPDKFEKEDSADGQILYHSKIGKTSIRVFVFKDISLETIGLDKIKDGMKFNVTRFIEPIKGKILKREDITYGKIVQSDFTFEINNAKDSRVGAGRFVVKGNKFVGFIYETSSPETNFSKTLRESFFHSIQIDQ